MGLRDIGATLPPGFRFYPSDEELVCHYLYKKIANEEALKGTLVEIDLHICEPWQLPEVAKLNTTEWYFFSFRDRKYATGFRTNRATTSGYWKATGKDRVILDPKTREIVGMRKTLVFYRNRAPNGIKTGWIMHEFRLESPHMPPKEDWVLCRVFHKGKAENNHNNNNYNANNYHTNHMMFDQTTASSCSPPLVASSPTNNDQLQQHPHTHTTCTSCQHPIKPPSCGPNPISSIHNNNYNNTDTDIPNNNNNNNDNDNNNSLSSATLNPSHVLHLFKEGSSNFSFSDLLINSNAKSDDEYGFLWDMDLDNLEISSSKLGEDHVKFGDDISSGIVFF